MLFSRKFTEFHVNKGSDPEPYPTGPEGRIRIHNNRIDPAGLCKAHSPYTEAIFERVNMVNSNLVVYPWEIHLLLCSCIPLGNLREEICKETTFL